MVRKVSTEAIDYLAEREGGMRLDVHDDGFGYATVGVGHLVMDSDNLKIGDTITRKQAEAFLQDDLLEMRVAVCRYVQCQLLDWEFDALVIFCFNVGVGNFRKSSLVRRLNSPIRTKCAVAREEMPRWKNVRGQYVRGLYNRRIDTVQMFCEGDYTVDWSGLEGQDH